MGTKLFNKATGLCFAFLLLTSFTINRWSTSLLLDHILPFFILLYIILIYLGFERREYRYFVAAGLAFPIALMLKNVTAALFITIPLFLLIFRNYRRSEIIKGIGLTYFFAFVVLSPWIYHVIFREGNLSLLLGHLVDIKRIKNSEMIPPMNESFSNLSL